jgi:hypothetical protein
VAWLVGAALLKNRRGAYKLGGEKKNRGVWAASFSFVVVVGCGCISCVRLFGGKNTDMEFFHKPQLEGYPGYPGCEHRRNNEIILPTREMLLLADF